MWEITNVLLPSGKIGSVGIEGKVIDHVRSGGIRDGMTSIYGNNCVLVPGLIDGHVHFRFPGGEAKEGWETGCRAALCGGVTTVGDMPNTDPPLTTNERFFEKLAHVGGRVISYRFWFGATSDNLNEARLVMNHPSVFGPKVYLAKTTGGLFFPKSEDNAVRAHFEICAGAGKIAAVHAEDQEIIDRSRGNFVGEPTVFDHCAIRSSVSEIFGAKRALRLQKETGCKMLLCHVSVPEVLEMAKDAKDQGRPVFTEVCPHHLRLHVGMMRGSIPAAAFKVNPPLRTVEQMMRMMELFLRPGFVDIVSSDHAPHDPADKAKSNYDEVPSGMPGVQTILPTMYDLVTAEKLPLKRFVELTSTNAARILGLEYKGRIEPGYDADLVLINPEQLHVIRAENMAYRIKVTPFAGMTTRGQVKVVVAKGVIHCVS